MSTATVNGINISDPRVTGNEIFALVEASSLSLVNKFLAYKPKTFNEIELKRLLTKVIKKGVKDFYRPILDPSFNNEGGICYVKGNQPAINKSFNWWKETATNFMPERNSRLGTLAEYIAFLGVLMKRLVDSGWSVADVWNAVCNDSIKLGHFWNSENNKQNIDATGSFEVAGFYDLANTMKIVTKDKETDQIWIVSGFYGSYSYEYCLAEIYNHFNHKDEINNSVGWIILEN